MSSAESPQRGSHRNPNTRSAILFAMRCSDCWDKVWMEGCQISTLANLLCSHGHLDRLALGALLRVFVCASWLPETSLSCCRRSLNSFRWLSEGKSCLSLILIQDVSSRARGPHCRKRVETQVTVDLSAATALPAGPGPRARRSRARAFLMGPMFCQYTCPDLPMAAVCPQTQRPAPGHLCFLLIRR